MLEGREISKSFDNRTVIVPSNLELFPGRKIALLGGSGAGKTTLLRILAGLLPPDSGEVVCDGVTRDFEEIREKGENSYSKWIYPKVTLIFQEKRLFPNLTAQDNCLVGFLGADIDSVKEDLYGLSDELEITGKLGQKPFQLSQGEQQRVAIVRGLLRKPKYLLLDEPTSALDPPMRIKLANVLKDRMSSTAALFSTHDYEFASLLGEQFLTIKNSKIGISNTLHDAVDVLAASN